MSTKKTTTNKPAAAETKATENKAALSEELTSKGTTDKVAAKTLAAPTADTGESIETAITHANQQGETKVAPEVQEAAEAVFSTDEARQATQINNANKVNDAKTLIERQREQGIVSEAQKAAAARIANNSDDSGEDDGKISQHDADSNKVQSIDAINEKAAKLTEGHKEGGKEKRVQVGLVEREPHLIERHVVTLHKDGRTSSELLPEHDNRVQQPFNQTNAVPVANPVQGSIAANEAAANNRALTSGK